MSSKQILMLATFAVAALIALLSFKIVPAGHRGVITNFGKVQPQVLGEGLHLMVPIMQQVHILSIQVDKDTVEAAAASRDMQDVPTTVAVNYHLDPSKVNWLYQHLGMDYKDRVISPAIQEVMKAVFAKYAAEELVTKREEVSDSVREQLARRLAPNAIVVDGLSIVNFRFSQSFSDAIEAKQTAEQQALKAQQDLTRIKIEAEQKVATAQAEAESLRLQKMQVTPELIKLREIETQRAAIDKWDGHLPNVTGGAMPFIQMPRGG